MKYLRTVHKVWVSLSFVITLGIFVFLGLTNISYAFSDAPPDDATEKTPSGVNGEQSEAESNPESRDFEQMEKDDAHYTQPASTREVPFHSTDENAYQDAKEKR